jgi:hypothetical protein
MTITETRKTDTEIATSEIDSADDAGTNFVEQTRSAAGQVRASVGGAIEKMPDVIESAKSGVEQVAERMPVVVERSRETAMRTTVSLQSLPDTTLRLLAGASIGLAAGLSLGRIPRVIALAALVPAIFVGSALATRPKTDPKPV